MRMFLPVSGHSSELSIANHSLRSTVLQEKCVSDAISSWFENHQSKKTSLHSQVYAPFIQNWNQVFRGYFLNSCNFKGNVQGFSAQRAASMTKPDLIFPAFSSRFLDFEVQFCFRRKFSFNEERCSSQVWQWRDFSRPITILCYAWQPMKLLHFV